MNAGCCPNVQYSFLCPSNPIHGIELEANGRCSCFLWARNSQDDVTCHRTWWKKQQHHMKQRFNQCRDTFRATETKEQIHTRKGSMYAIFANLSHNKNQQTYRVNRSYMDPIMIWKKVKELYVSFLRFFDPPFLNAWLHGFQHPKTQRLRTTRTVVSTGPWISFPICDVNKTWQEGQGF